MDKYSKIYVAGHKGLVGSAIVRNLKAKGYENIIYRTHNELDLINQKEVENFFKNEKPEYVFLAAAKVGGINSNNTYPADFIYENMMIQNNVIKSAHDFKVKKLLFLGSTCIYPKLAEQPISESELLTGSLEPTNEAYAIAKISGLEMCKFYKRQYGDNFISCMPTNLYGPNDNYDLKNSHVLPALLRKFHEAKLYNHDDVEIWGTGTPLREFLYVDDMADACTFLMENYNGEEHVNIGTGEEITIKELAEVIRKVVGFKGNIRFNASMPDGTPRKLTNINKIKNMGWKAKVNLYDGITVTYQNYIKEFMFGDN
ncbi:MULTISPECIES: GDP-L-fucose synthase [Clostridium]|nr:MULTISPECIES: GDP-L-fucose synthase [Clostridium]EMU55272.1 GDP-L-fucose synthetase [Clostridium butyricum DKU-01]KIU08522.1 GDP-L-fucose synthetase [Clostridium butyricum]MBA8968355.1 GDP-L-fucose synthase [Clostridium butyricum]MBA8970590.1 GDP-L-fucose synthase [Clostridium butyricum]MBC2426689.1 GDP-L-fucose synthase [Clostridium butyricum]